MAVILAAALCAGLSCAKTHPAPAGARTFTDELGRTIRVKPRPERIVSLAPSVTEILFALGLDRETVGVTSYCDYPPEAQQKEKVGDTQRPSVEKIVALRPDLVIASTSSQLEQFVTRLEEIGVPVYVSSPRDLDGVLASIERIGEISGVPDRAQALGGRLRARVDEVRRRVGSRPAPRVFLILGEQPLITAGRPSFITDLIKRAGGQSISGDEPGDYPQYSLETAVARQPEVIFLQSGDQELPTRLKITPASRAGRVFHLNDDLLLRPGPRIVEGLEQMALKIHPESFRESAGPGTPEQHQ